MLDSSGAILAVDVLVTEIGGKKSGKIIGGSAADTDRRILELDAWLRDLIAWFSPAIVVAEATGGSKGARAAIATASANATIAIATRRYDLELVRVHVQQWRRVFVPSPVGGTRKITDEELYDAIGKAAEERVIAELASRKKPAGLKVHALDAIGIGRWGVWHCSKVRRAVGVDVGGL